MELHSMEVKNEILDAVQILIDNALKNITTIQTGTCVSLGQSHICTMKINGKIYDTVMYYGDSPMVNKQYRVFIPNGNINQSFILTNADAQPQPQTENKWELISSVTLTENTKNVDLSKDINGNSFELIEARLYCNFKSNSLYSTASPTVWIYPGLNNGSARIIQTIALNKTTERSYLYKSFMNGNDFSAEVPIFNTNPCIINSTATSLSYFSVQNRDANSGFPQGCVFHLYGIRK